MRFYIIFISIFTINFNDVLSSILGGFTKKVDLSRPLDVTPIAWPLTETFHYTREVGQIQADGSWFAQKEMCLGEHGGTHIDAPYHFSEHGWKLGDIPLDRFFTQGVVIDICKEVESKGPETELTVDHIKKWELRNGMIPPGAVVLVRTCWSKYFGNYSAYMGSATAPRFPGISAGAATLMVTRKIYGVGIDTASLDKGSSTTYDTHKIMLTNNIYGLENVNILAVLPARGIWLIIMPINLQYGTGGPVRIIAYPKTILNSLFCVL